MYTIDCLSDKSTLVATVTVVDNDDDADDEDEVDEDQDEECDEATLTKDRILDKSSGASSSIKHPKKKI